MSCYVEGCIVKYAGVFWMVRGTSHPIGTLLALPRYAVEGRSIKEPDELISIAKMVSTDIVRFSACYGRPVPLVRLVDVEEYLSPLTYCDWFDDPIACTLVDELKSVTGVKDIGVTGSRLARHGKDVSNSDIDVIVYGRDVDIFYDKLAESRILARYEKKDVLKLSRERGWPPPGPLLERELGKRLQGIWKGIDVYIRLVLQEPGEYKPCTNTVYYLGEWFVEGSVKDASKGHVFPCTYKIVTHNVSGNNIILTSPRGRFCESLKEGDHVRAWGRLELVRPDYTGSSHLQLVLTDAGHGIELVEVGQYKE